MEQVFSCPHCGQLLTASASMAGVEVQCSRCSGRSIVPGFAAVETPSPIPVPATDRSTAANSHKPSPTAQNRSGGNRKLLVAAGAVLVSACLPILLFAAFHRTSTATTIAAAPAAPAPSPAATTQSSAAAAPVVDQPVEVASQTTPVAAGAAPHSDANRSDSRAPTRSSSRPTPGLGNPTGNAARALASNTPDGSRMRGGFIPPVQTLAAPIGQRASTTELVEQVEPSVVIVDTGDGLGSGFVYDDQGTIITNYHVIEGAKKAEIKFADKSSAAVTGFLAVSPGKDLAILRFNPAGRRLNPLTVAASRPSKGESVLAFGAPRGLGSTVSDGIISAVREGTELRDTFKAMTKADIYVDHLHYDLDAVWLQTTAPISGGNSGGPLVNLQGEVVGLNTWNRSDGQNLNFAISAEHIKKLMQSAQSGVQPLASLPAPRQKTFAAGAGQRTLEYWDEVSRINRTLAGRIKKLRQPPLPTNRQKLFELFPKLAGIYQKLGDWLPETAAKLKALKIDDVDEELVALVAVDAIYLEKFAEEFRSMATDAKMMQKVTLLDTNKLAAKSYGEFEKTQLSAAYDILRIKLTNRYNLTFASILSESRGKSAAKSDDQAADEPATSDEEKTADAATEKQAAGKLRLAKSLKNAGKLDVARQRLEQIVKDFPDTEAAKEAAALLEEFDQ